MFGMIPTPNTMTDRVVHEISEVLDESLYGGLLTHIYPTFFNCTINDY
jgi:hypothetical protein